MREARPLVGDLRSVPSPNQAKQWRSPLSGTFTTVPSSILSSACTHAGCEAVRPRAPQIEMPAIFTLESGEKWYIGAAEDGSALMRFDTPGETHITV